ncbi:succinate dehydrogenase assembly factor 2 [Candidatus Endowatersipora endosymbiont of Watersipora subatra]|uniref:FAD assembly factor SdhE n=1 Tax=Candidatus Endowatersipora endosymbiont of Watersipora subatra TaxID=3077946 RepID=UPI00312CB6AB
MIRSSSDLDHRRKRILYRAWHLGTCEFDYILGHFVNQTIAILNDDHLDQLEQLMKNPNLSLSQFQSHSTSIPKWNSDVLDLIKQFHLEKTS